MIEYADMQCHDIAGVDCKVDSEELASAIGSHLGGQAEPDGVSMWGLCC